MIFLQFDNHRNALEILSRLFTKILKIIFTFGNYKKLFLCFGNYKRL